MVKRYKFDDILKHDSGREYVGAEDYAALEYEKAVLQGQMERLQMELSNTIEHAQELEAECERLRETNKMLQANVKEHEDTINGMRDYIQQNT